ncbi:MAG: hypothetical protein NC293_05260 [Roseburia sp.]|nr:hypothetical protein [Roseburia sp.]
MQSCCIIKLREALLQKIFYCHDRKVKDSRGRSLCGYTLQDGDKVVVIADQKIQNKSSEMVGSVMLEKKYCTKVYSIITDKDIKKAIDKTEKISYH